MDDRIPLPLILREIANATGEPAPEYHRVYKEVLTGNVPAEHQRGRWFIRRQDIPQAVAALGMTLRADYQPALTINSSRPQAAAHAVAA